MLWYEDLFETFDPSAPLAPALLDRAIRLDQNERQSNKGDSRHGEKHDVSCALTCLGEPRCVGSRAGQAVPGGEPLSRLAPAAGRAGLSLHRRQAPQTIC